MGLMERSAWLTKGYRWKVLGIALLPVVIGVLVHAVASAALRALVGPGATAAGEFVWQSVFIAYGAITAVVTYHDLRVAKEGVDIDRIAAVFD